jgi:hypothetical protein
MKLINALCIGSALLALGSCKKEKDEVPVPPASQPQVTYDNYSNLKVGNYWIYQEFSVDSLGNGPATSDFDSCYVEKDTSMNGKMYHKLVTESPAHFPYQEIILLRDSLSYTVNVQGMIRFSSTDFTSVFNHYYLMNPSDTTAEVSSVMINDPVSTIVPAGSFSTLDFRTTYNMHPPYAAAGHMRYMHARYAKNIGLVAETQRFFAGSPNYTERRLVRYHLN